MGWYWSTPRRTTPPSTSLVRRTDRSMLCFAVCWFLHRLVLLTGSWWCRRCCCRHRRDCICTGPAADKTLLEHYTGLYGGGLSGRPIKARSTAQAAAAVAATKAQGRMGTDEFVVVHVGGLETADDIAASRQTGAQLRQWYTGLMHGLAEAEPERLYARVTGVAK